MKTKIILAVIVVLSGLIRVWGLGENPPALNWDEASLGYNAYSILKTGKDEWGSTMPLIFPAFGDYKLPVYVYSLVPFVGVLGLNPFSVRLLSTIAGTLTVLISFFLVKQIFKISKTNTNYKGVDLSLFAPVILGLLPWHIFLSRPALEANLGLCFFSFGLYLLIRSLENFKVLFPASIFLGLSMHTYNSYRVLVPVLAVLYLIFFFKKINFKSSTFILSLLVSILFSSLVIFQISSGTGLARYQKLKILNENSIYQIGEKRSQSTLPEPLPKLIYNRPIYFVTSVAKSYLSYFTPQFWNQSKGAQYQFAIPGQSLATMPIIILVLFGLFFLVKKTEPQLGLFLLFSFLFTPLAASLTIDPPQAIRPSPMIIFLPVLASFGLLQISQFFNKSKELFYSLTMILISLFSLSYLYNYWTSYPLKYSGSWQYGYKQVFDYISENHPEVEKVFVTKRYGEPHIFYAIYNQIDPNVFHNKEQTLRFAKSDWLWTDKVGKYYFVNDWQIPTNQASLFTLESGQKIPAAGSILVTSPEKIPKNSTLLKVINFLDGESAFIIVSIP